MAYVEAGPWTDPIVEEVRAAREAIAARYGYDIDKIAAALADRSKAAGRQTVSPARPSPSEPFPASGNSSRGQ